MIAVLLLLGACSAAAVEDPPQAKPEANTEVKPQAAAEDKLALEQQRIADRYTYLEEVLLRMAELTAGTDPRRSALLRQAVAQSKDRLVGVQFDQMSELLKRGQLSRALENQAELDKDLRALLELLLSENRSRQLESEKARIREYLKQLGRLILQQRDIQGQTGGGGDPKRLSTQQGALAERTGRLSDDIRKSEESSREAQGHEKNQDQAEQDPKKSQPQEGPQGDPSGKQGQQGEQHGQQGQEQSQQGQQGQQQGQQGQQQGQQGQQGRQGQPQGQPPAPQEDPARKRLDAARQRMKEAEEKLNEAQRAGAMEKQEQALRELEQAKAELEKILRQLREEEIARTLAMLEARFKRMLDIQRVVYKGTQRLDAVPAAQRTHGHEIEAGRLGDQEAQIVLEADKALVLLGEDGTAVAFPEAVSQMREDMQQVVARLRQARVDRITQSIEEDIIAALEEMIEALQRAIQEQQQRRQQPPPQQQGQPQDPALVDMLAELKMIRALQMRINRRTARYSKLLEGPEARQGELLDALRKLAERQSRVYRITRDLEIGKNQ